MHLAIVYVIKPALGWYGTGSPGTLSFVPGIGTGGEIPRLGNADFMIELTETLARAPCVIAASLTPAEISLAGMTLYGPRPVDLEERVAGASLIVDLMRKRW